jgi:predicted TIM-barrel fold metal-dependent hydrolase
MATERFASVDDHVLEHPKVWTKRMSKAKWGDRIPHLKESATGAARWVVDGKSVPLSKVADVGAVLGMPSAQVKRWSDVPEAAWDARARLKIMDTDGVDRSVLYPMVAGVAGETFGRITDPKLELACVQAYNDWLIEEWSAVSPRFIPQCIVPLDPEAAAKEIRRAVGIGHKGVVFPSIPLHLRDNVPHINDEAYEPLWSACEELGVPVCFHSGASPELVMEPWSGFSPKVAEAYRAITRPAANSTIVGNMLMSRAVRFHPKLKVVFSESALGWIVFALEMGDHQFDNMGLKSRGYDHSLTELFRRQCYVSAWYDKPSLHHALKHVGADNILWSTNFPQTTSNWPNSQSRIVDSFDGVKAADRDKILWGNAARVYGL